MKSQLLLLVQDPDIQFSFTQHPSMTVTVVSDLETALEKLHQTPFDAILYSEFLSPQEENKLQKISSLVQEGIMLARKGPHESWDYCVGKVQEALKELRMRNVFITDDALKNAHFNICLN